MVKITSLNGYHVLLSGKAEESVIICQKNSDKLISQIKKMPDLADSPDIYDQRNEKVIVARFKVSGTKGEFPFYPCMSKGWSFP
jgi:hypothetical protein